MGKKIQYIGKYNMDEVLLGKGNFARVELATHQITEIKVAIKVIDTKKIKEDYIRQNLHREAKIMSKLRHPNIIRLYETMKAQTLYCLVLEYAAGGELLAYIKSQDNSRLAESEARTFVRQLVSALHYLHEKNVVHRDLKMENIMLDEKKKSIKLIDFGLSNTFKTDEQLRTHCGSPEYAAPELFMVGKTYGSEVDIWSLGIVIYAIVIGKLPFFTPYKDEYQRQRMQQQIQKGLSSYHEREMQILHSDCRNLLHQILEPNPEARISLCDIEKHSWITKNGKYPFSPYMKPPKDKQLRHQCTAEMAIMTGHKRMMLEETVKEHKADEMSAMFNMLMDKKKKQRGLFDVDHTYKRGRHDRDSRSRSRDREKIQVKTPDSAKGKEIKGKMLKKGIHKAKLNNIARPSSLGTPTEILQKTVMSPKRSTPSHGPKPGADPSNLSNTPPTYHSLSTPHHKQPAATTINPCNTLAVPSPTHTSNPGSNPRPPDYTSNKPNATTVPATNPATSRVPFSQRSNPPAKLNMTLDLSVTHTPRRQRPQLIQESEADWDRLHKQVGASVGIAASSGVRPKVCTSPTKETKASASAAAATRSPSKKSSICSPSRSTGEGGKKPLRPSTLWYIRTSLEKVRRRIPSASSDKTKEGDTAAGGIECNDSDLEENCYGGTKETLAPKATPEDSLIDFCSPGEVGEVGGGTEEVVVVTVEVMQEREAEVPRQKYERNTSAVDSEGKASRKHCEKAAAERSFVVERGGKGETSVKTVSAEKSETTAHKPTDGDECVKTASGDQSMKISSDDSPARILENSRSVKEVTSQDFLPSVGSECLRSGIVPDNSDDYSLSVTLPDQSSTMPDVSDENAVKFLSDETSARLLCDENLLRMSSCEEEEEEMSDGDILDEEEEPMSTSQEDLSVSPTPASVKQKEASSGQHPHHLASSSCSKQLSFEVVDHNYDSSTSQLSRSSQNSLGMCPMSHVRHNFTGSGSSSLVLPQHFHNKHPQHQQLHLQQRLYHHKPSGLRDLCGAASLLPSSGSEPLSVGVLKHPAGEDPHKEVPAGSGRRGGGGPTTGLLREGAVPNTLSFSNPGRLDNSHLLSCEACGLSPDSPTYWNKHARFSHSGAHALDVFTSPDEQLQNPTEAFWEPETGGEGNRSPGAMYSPRYKLPTVGADTPRIPMQLPMASLELFDRDSLGSPKSTSRREQEDEEEVLVILNHMANTNSPEKCRTTATTIHIDHTTKPAQEPGVVCQRAVDNNNPLSTDNATPTHRSKSPAKACHIHTTNTNNATSPCSKSRPQCPRRTTDAVYTPVPDTSLRLEPVGGSSESLDERVQGDGCTEKVDGGQGTNSTPHRHPHPPHHAQGDEVSCQKGQCPGAPTELVKTSVRAAKKQMRNLLQWEKRLMKTEHTKPQSTPPPPTHTSRQANCTATSEMDPPPPSGVTDGSEKKKEGSRFLRQYSPRSKLHSWKQGVSHLLSKSRPGTANNVSSSANHRQQSNKSTSPTSQKNRANSIGSNKYSSGRGERCNSIEEAEDKFLQMEHKWTAPLSAPTSNNTVLLTVQSAPVPNSCPGHAPPVFDLAVSRGESPVEYQPCQQCAKLEQKNSAEKKKLSKNGTSPKKPVIIARIPSTKASSSRV